MKPGSPSVSAIVVSYNVAELLDACLGSLEQVRTAGELAEIIVVDSSSVDESAGMVRESYPNARLYVVPNHGFGAAVNVGFSHARGKALFVLNPDTVVCPGAIPALAGELFAEGRTGVVGPRLVYPDGQPQPSRRRFPTRWTPLFESTIIEEWLPGNRWARRYRMLDRPAPTEGSEPVDWIVGAAMMVKRQTVLHAGGFDESFWLYGEELEWCYRIRCHGWTIRYVPGATVVHHEGASTSQDRLASRLAFDRGRVRAQRAIYGSGGAGLARAMVKINYILQILREGLKWAAGHRRDLRRRRVADYWRLLRSDLDG